MTQQPFVRVAAPSRLPACSGLLFLWLAMVIFWHPPWRAAATVLGFEPPEILTNAPAGTLPEAYGQRARAASQDGFAYGEAGGFTPDLELEFSTRRLESDRPGYPSSFGVQVAATGWNHGAAESALRVLQADGAADQELRVRLRGTDTVRPLLRSFELVGRGGVGAVIPMVGVHDGALTWLFVSNNVAVPASGALRLRFDPPLAAEQLHLVIALGRQPPAVGLDNLEFGQETVAPSVWVFEVVKAHTGTGNCRDLAEVSGLVFDPQGRALLAWTEQNGCGGSGTGWWARREPAGWAVHQITASPYSPDFSRYSPNGGLGLTLSSNGVPFLFHPVANFASDSPYLLARVNLDRVPAGPGEMVHSFGGGRSPDLGFGIASAASVVPDFVTHIARGPILLGGSTPVSSNVPEIAGELVFRHGPQRQTHLLYQNDKALIYNPGVAAQERPVLRINAGASPHAMAVDADNGVHISAAQGDGASYFGAVGRLAYLYSPDGLTWTTNLLGPTEVGATAIALDSQGRPAIAFTRGFNQLYFMRQTESGWTRPGLVRQGLGGWDRSRTVRLTFDGNDVPHLALYDDLTRRTFVVSPQAQVRWADLAVEIRAATNHVALGATNAITVTLINRSSRNAAHAAATVTLPPEMVVRDFQPRPTRSEGATYTYALGTLQAFEARELVVLGSALDPTRLCVQASVRSDAPEANPADNVVESCVAEFLPSPCLAAAPPADCGTVALLPERLPPALAGQPWAVNLRWPLASPGSVLRVTPATLPPGFCLTADGQLRGFAGAPGEWSLRFELGGATGPVETFTRTLTIQPDAWPAGLVGFWPLDGDGQDLVSGNHGTIGARTTFVAGPGGLAAQSGRDLLDDPRGDLKEPAPLLATGRALDGVTFGDRPVTLVGWFRRDGLAKSRGDPAPRGAIFSLSGNDTWTRERHLVFNPANGRLEVLDGPPDFRANVLSGPVVPGNEWHQVALVNAGRRTRLYVDAALVGERDFPATLADRLALTVGGWAHGDNYSGAVDDVMLFDRALSGAELAAWREGPLPRKVLLPPGGDFPLAASVAEVQLPDAVEGRPYHAALAGAFCGTPVRFALGPGNWPTELGVSEQGVVSGSPNAAGAFAVRLRAWDAAGYAAELTVRLSVRPNPPRFALEPGDQQVDFGGTLVLLAETQRPAALQWYFNGGPLAGQTQPLLTVDSFSREQAGVYQLRAENEAGVAWSREATVRVTVPVAAQAGVGLSDIALRADGLIRLRVATIRGRVYELQRALDLTLPAEQRWRTVQRFVAVGEEAELQDVVTGRPDAAFYRVVERPGSPAAAFSLADDTRFIGVADDGKPRPGLLPFQDPVTGRLGPFELRFAGNESAPDTGLSLRLPEGALALAAEDGATQLQFSQGEFSFGEESPIQFDEDETGRLVIASTPGVILPAGPPTVADFERLLGKPPGSGIRVVLYRQFRFRLLRGTFEGDRIRQARLAWVESGALRAPTPAETADLPDFDLELAATRIRLAYHGEFTLPDGTASPAKLVVPAGKPLWLELGPGGYLQLGGTAELSFADGPALLVEVLAAPPDYRLTVRAKGIRVPETVSLGNLLPDVPLLPGSGAMRGIVLHDDTSADELLLAALRNAEYASCASAALKRLVASGGAASSVTPEARAEENDLISEKLDLFNFWRCVVMQRGYDNWTGLEEVPHQLEIQIERLLASPPTDFGGLVDRGGGFAFEFHARLVAELGGLALQLSNHPEFAHRAYDAYLLLRKVTDEGDCESWDPTSIQRGLKALMQVRVLDPDEQIFPAGTWRDFEVWTARIVACSAERLRRQLGVADGEKEPYNNPSILTLRRYEARARLEETVALMEGAQLAGLQQPVVPPDLLSQLMVRIWADLGPKLRAATNACDVRTWRYLRPEVVDLVEARALAEDAGQDSALSQALATLPDATHLSQDVNGMLEACGEDAVAEGLTSNRPEHLAADLRVLRRLLEDVPPRMRQPIAAVRANLTLLRERIEFALVQPLRRRQFRLAQLVDLLEAGLAHDRLVLRFNLGTNLLVLPPHLTVLRATIQDNATRDQDVAALQRALRLMQSAVRLTVPVPPPRRLAGRPRPAAETEEGSEWPRAVTAEALELAQALHQLASEAALAEDQGGLRLPDIRLPGGLSIDEAIGELSFHTERRELAGRLGGILKLPGAGLELTLRNAAFSSGGAFAGELFGSLALPPANPAVTLRIPALEPARFEFVRGGAFRLSGGGRIRFPNGAEAGCFLSLDHPVYQLAASASGLRLRLAKAGFDRIGLPTAVRVPEDLAARALDYLARAGLTLEGLQPDPAVTPFSGVRLGDPSPRPHPGDTDDLVATAAALDLLLRAPGALNPRPSPALHDDPPAGPAPDPNAVTLLKQLAAQMDRHATELGRDADELSELDLAVAADAARVPPAEIAALRGARLVEVARRLGSFGADYATALGVLKFQVTGELLGAAEVEDLGTLLRPYFDNTAACLRALRTNLVAWALVPGSDPPRHDWARGPHWNGDAAQAGIMAAARLLQNMQLTGYGEVGIEADARRVACLLRELSLAAELERLGLDPRTGAIPERSADLAAYLSLDRAEAIAGLRRLLELQAADQLGLCDPDERLTRAVPALALRARDLVVAQVHELQDQFADRFAPRSAARPWEHPEAMLAATTNLFEILNAATALGTPRYPHATFRITRGFPAPQHETDDPSVDVAEALSLLQATLGQLDALLQDERSGYPAELRRRRLEQRGVLVPPASLMAMLAGRFPTVAGHDEVRVSIQNLARFEAGLLEQAAGQPGLTGQIGRDGAGLVRRIVNLLRWLDEPAGRMARAAAVPGDDPSGRARLQPSLALIEDQAARQQPRAGETGFMEAGQRRRSGPTLMADPARDRLTGVVLPAVNAALAADPNTPWWVHTEVARALLEAGKLSWSEPAVVEALRNSRIPSQNAAQQRVAALLEAVRARELPFDLALPGDLEIQRLFGSVLLNVQTRYVRVELGGRIEFPSVRTPGGDAAYFDLRRLRLESNGRFDFDAATRGPLPFEGSAFAGRFSARGDWPTRALDLHGEGELTFAVPPLNPETGQPFAPTLTAALDYEPIGYDAQGQPEGWRFAIRTSGAFRQGFGTHLAVFGAAAGITVGRTAGGQPLGGVTVGGSVGLIRKPDRLTAEPPAPEDFQLLIEDAEVAINGIAGQGGSATISRGTVRLPEAFYPAELPAELRCEGPGATRTGTSISIQQPLGFSYELGGKPRLQGVLRFAQFGLRVPRAEFLSFVLCEANLGLDDDGLPFLDVPRAGMLFEVPWDKGVIRLQNLHLGLDGQVRGQLLLVEDFDLFRSGDFRATLLGVPALADPQNAPPGGCRGTQLTLEDVPGFDAPRLVLAGAVRVDLPLAALKNSDGSKVGAAFCGGIRIEPTDRGPAFSAFVDELAFEGEFDFGSPKVRLRNARLVARNFDGILAPNSEAPFHFSVSGTLQTGPFSFGLDDAQLRYLGPERLPGFSLAAVRFSRDATQPLPPPLNFLPFAVDFAEFRFKNPQVDLDQLFRPENLRVTASGRIGLPAVERAFVRGGVSGLVFEFNPDGSPIPPALDGFDLAVSGTADVQIPMAGNLGGKLRVGGLQRALRDGPQHIYFVGDLGATMQGYKLNLLSAFTLAAPIGMCLDVSLGGAGIILTPTPFQIVGASGGFAFLTTDDPCDFTKYFAFDPAAGIYQLKQTIELPSIPIGLTWADFMRVVTEMQQRAAAFAGNFDPGSIALPGLPSGGARVLPNLQSDHPSQARERARPTSDAAASARLLAADSPAAFGCPTNCPPPTVGLLCQPHPDRTAFANRVIFKFTSIPEAILNAEPPSGLGIRRDSLTALGSSPDAIATTAAARLVNWLEEHLPAPGDGLDPGKAGFLAQQQQAALAGLRTVAHPVIAAAVRASPDAYAALRQTLYAGMPCPDLTLALGGKVSMVGLSSFGWIEGREVSSLSGSGGVIGELHVLGIPVGEARAFMASTDANGDPNPSLCGEAEVSLGPLDLAKVNLGLDCEGCVTEFLRLFPTLAMAVGEPFLRESLGRLRPELVLGNPRPADLVNRVALLPPAEQLPVMLGFLGDVQSASHLRLPGNLAEIVRRAVAATWSRINPRLVLCGEIQPRLFGLPLTLGGRTAALNFLATKEGYLGEFAFSPSNLCPLFPPGDEAAFSFALQARDPYGVLLGAFDGRLNDPAELAALVKEQVEYALQHQILAANYQWHPFGLELGDAAVRFLLPDVFEHPALPGSRWRNPDGRAHEGLPSRDDVLVAAAASGRLGRAFEWLGDANDFSAIFPADDPRAETLRTRGLSLRRDYFPHGGMVGGARMALPRILMAKPSEWLGLYQTAISGADLFQRFGAAMTLLNEYVLRTETNGTAALYVPAPNPPVLYREDGEPLEDYQLEQLLSQEPGRFTPEGLMRELRIAGANGETLRHLVPDELAFLRAQMTNLTILGVPVFGTATLTGRPTPVRVFDGQPLARLEFDVAADSWLGRVTGAEYRFGADIYATPEQNLAQWARALIAEMDEQRTAALRGTAPVFPSESAFGRARLHDAASALDRLPLELARQLPRFAVTNALPAMRVSGLRDWTATPLASEDGEAHGGLRSRGKSLRSAPLLATELELLAFSPLYDPATAGEGPVAEARRQGGLAARGRIEVFPDSPARAGAGEVELSLTAGDEGPRLSGRVRDLNLPTPFAGVSLQNAQGDFDNAANPFLTARTTVAGLNFGPLFRIASPGGGNALASEVQLGTGTIAGLELVPRFSLACDPARLTSERLGGHALVLHGSSGTASRFLVTETGWDARVSFAPGPARHAELNDLVLRATLAGVRRDVLKLGGLPAQPFSLRGSSLDGFEVKFAAPVLPQLTIELFPGLNLPALPERTLDLASAPDGAFEFRFSSDGRFYLLGRLARSFPAGVHGVFAAGAELRVDETGATISGTVGTSSGTLRISELNGQIAVQFSAQLTLPALCALDGRVCLSGPEGSDLVATAGPGGLCVNGAVLTLRDFAPGATPLTYTLPAFCLDAARGFANVQPAAGLALHAGDDAALPVSGFLLDALRDLRLSGNFDTRRLVLAFESVLRAGTMVATPVSGTVGSDGLRLRAASGSLTLLGFDFDDVSFGATNAVGELPAVAFSGRLPFLPAPFNTVRFAGDLPASGGFRFAPVQRLDLPAFVPAFPLSEVLPAFTHQPRPYVDALREEGPSGYWRLDDDAGVAADSRRNAYFGPIIPRPGEYLGTVQRGQPGAPGVESARAARFDGVSGWVRLPESVPTPGDGGFTVSLWFRRASGAAPVAPQTLVGGGNQWSVQLTGSPVEGTRLKWRLNGLQTLEGAAAPALASQRRFGVDDLTWHHVVAVYDGAAQWLYLDGRLDAWQPVRGRVDPDLPADARASLGALAGNGGAAEYFNGWLDEVAIFPTALGPLSVLSQWLAAGQGGLILDGVLPAATIPGLPAVSGGGVLGRDGSVVLEVTSPEEAGFGGLRLPQFSGLLVRSGGAGAVAFRGRFSLPQLDAQPLGTVQGVLASDGRFVAEAADFAARGAFGWDLQLRRFVVSGDWRTPALQAELGGDLRLPFNLGTLSVAGSVNPTRNQYTLTGVSGGGLNLGTLPFSITSVPKLTEQRLEIGGVLALGATADAARFNTSLIITKSGEVDARFGGTTGWIRFEGDTHGQLRWDGRLGYVDGFPALAFHGTLGLSWPTHPASLDDLAAGLRTQTRRDCWTDPLGEPHCVDTPIGMTLRLASTPITVDRRGGTTVPVSPSFRDTSEVSFTVQPQ